MSQWRTDGQRNLKIELEFCEAEFAMTEDQIRVVYCWLGHPASNHSCLWTLEEEERQVPPHSTFPILTPKLTPSIIFGNIWKFWNWRCFLLGKLWVSVRQLQLQFMKQDINQQSQPSVENNIHVKVWEECRERKGGRPINIGLMRLAAPYQRSKNRLLWDRAPYMRSRAK